MYIKCGSDANFDHSLKDTSVLWPSMQALVVNSKRVTLLFHFNKYVNEESIGQNQKG